MDSFMPDAAAKRSETRPPPSRGKLVLRLFLMILLLVIVCGGLYGYDQFRQNMIAQYFAASLPPPIAVSTVVAETAAMPRFLNGIGTIVAVHQVTISPELSGRVTGIMFEAGQTVKEGDPLVQLNDAPEQADLAAFQAQEQLAIANLDEYQREENAAVRYVAA